MIITTSVPTTYNLALPSGLITLYNCTFADGSSSKTLTVAGTLPITLTPPSSPNVSVVAEVWSTQRLQTFVVQLTDDYYVDPYYIKHTPYYVKPKDRQDACPILYSSATDMTSISSGTLFTDLPTATFTALDKLEFVYDRESYKLWVLSNQYPVSVVDVEDWSTDPVVALFNLRDASDNRFFIFVHSSGNIRKLDTNYAVVSTVQVGAQVVDAVQFPISSTLTDFVVLSSDGTLYKYNIALTQTLTATSKFVKLLSDAYNKQSLSIIHGLTALGDMYSISTTLIFTSTLSNVLTLAGRLNTGSEYFWAYSTLYQGFANIISNGLYPDAQGFPNSFPLEYSSDLTYQRVSDAWSTVYVGVGKSVVSFPDGANPYIRFVDSSLNSNYVGRRRLNKAVFSVGAGYYTPTLNLLAYSIAHHTATIQVVGVNTELGIDWPPEIELTITDYYTGLPITTITDDCVINISAVNKYLDPSFFLTIGKAAQELKIGGRVYIPDVPRLVGMYYGIVANPIQPESLTVAETPSVVFIDTPQTSSLQVSFNTIEDQVQQIDLMPDPINLPVVQFESATANTVDVPLFGVDCATASTIDMPIFGVDCATASTIDMPIFGIDVATPTTVQIADPYLDMQTANWSDNVPTLADAGTPVWSGFESVFTPNLDNTALPELMYPALNVPLTSKYAYSDYWYWSKEPLQTKFYKDEMPYTYPIAAKWFKLGADTSFSYGYTYKFDTWFDATLLGSWFNLSDPYSVPLYPSQYQYGYEFYVPIYAEYYYERYAGQIDHPNVQWFPRTPDLTMEILPSWRIYEDWSSELYPQHTIDYDYSVGITPQVLDFSYFHVDLDPQVLDQQHQDVAVYPQTLKDQHSYGFEILFNGIQETKFYVTNPKQTNAVVTLLPNLIGLPAGYFNSELDALQNAVKVWSMLPEHVFAQKLSTGYWVWTRVPDCDNLCSGSGCTVSGYITGG
jgi:hypothetical protein